MEMAVPTFSSTVSNCGGVSHVTSGEAPVVVVDVVIELIVVVVLLFGVVVISSDSGVVMDYALLLRRSDLLWSK